MFDGVELYYVGLGWVGMGLVLSFCQLGQVELRWVELSCVWLC